MANTNINIRMDADLKRQFEAFCADMGICLLYTSGAAPAVRQVADLEDSLVK